MVRVVGEGVDNEIHSIREALKIADEMGLDLVEISPNANPPVCKLMDYKKFLFDQKKKQKEIKAKATKVVIKEIRLGPQTDDHDFEFKLNHAKRFLEDGAKVKVLETDAKWCGVTYKEDSEPFKKFISNLKELGKYPVSLWNK